MRSDRRGLPELLGSLFDVLDNSASHKLHVFTAFAGILCTVGLWLFHLKNPDPFGFYSAGRGPYYLILIPPPFVAVFSIGRLLFPKLERPPTDQTGPFALLLDREQTARRRNLVIVAGIAAAANFLFMMVTARQP